MRTICFDIKSQIISISPDCDTYGIVSGTSGYLFSKFKFSKEWDGTVKVAEFRRQRKSKAYPVPIINGICEIPSYVLTGSKFYVRVVGKNEAYIITTNSCMVRQEV